MTKRLNMKLGTRWISVFLIVLCLTLVGWTAYGQKAKVSRPAWEYKMVILPRSSDQAQTTMNEKGAEGWELIQARFPAGDGYDLVLLFKRPK
ncbi:MAG: DUF4177 domain-containing protein [Blastocatellia bacterium]